MQAVVFEQVEKRFDRVRALDSCTFAVAVGESYALLGHPGAGKRTALQLAHGLIRPDTGTVQVLGARDARRVAAQVGLFSGQMRVLPQTSVIGWLRLAAVASGLSGTALASRIASVIDMCALDAVQDTPLAALPLAAARRALLAQAIVHEPTLLLADQPTVRLPATEQPTIWKLLQHVAAAGTTVLLATSDAAEAETVATRIGLLVRGAVVAEMQSDDVRGAALRVQIRCGPLSPALRAQLVALSPAVRCDEQRIQIAPNDAALQHAVTQLLLDAGVSLLSLESAGRPLDRIYARAMRGEALQVPAPARQYGDTLLTSLLGAQMTNPHETRALPIDEPAVEER